MSIALKHSAVPIEYQLIGLTENGNAGDLLLGLDPKQGHVRLQTLISEWLRMETLLCVEPYPEGETLD